MNKHAITAQEREQILHRLHTTTENFAKIGEAFNRSPWTIKRIAQVVGVSAQGRDSYSSCTSCGAGISWHNKSGRCQPCGMKHLNSDPKERAKRSERLKRAYQDPEKLRRARLRIKENFRVAMENPEKRERFCSRARERFMRNVWSPEARAKWYAAQPHTLEKAFRTRFAWCPPEYLEQYRFLRQTKHLSYPQAKQIILDEIRVAKERAVNRLSPFERQEIALQKGAGLTEGYSRVTLGGVRRA